MQRTQGVCKNILWGLYKRSLKIQNFLVKLNRNIKTEVKDGHRGGTEQGPGVRAAMLWTCTWPVPCPRKVTQARGGFLSKAQVFMICMYPHLSAGGGNDS